jgi:beta-lactamase superfamily II metal-dependent hydrolase
VSSGAYSIYHHPSPETVQRMLKRHIPYLDTKTAGDISIVMIGPLRVLIASDGTIALV